jgi:hypothetical protein
VSGEETQKLLGSLVDAAGLLSPTAGQVLWSRCSSLWEHEGKRHLHLDVPHYSLVALYTTKDQPLGAARRPCSLCVHGVAPSCKLPQCT